MTCPDLLRLSELADGEVGSDDPVRSHVDGCAACRATLSRMVRATDGGRAMLGTEPATASRGADCPAPDALAGWAMRTAAPESLRAVASHLDACDACLAEALGIVRLMARLDAGPTLAVPSTLRERVASRWAPAPAETSLTSLVVRIARAGMALVERHVVAPVLEVEVMPVALAAVRSPEPVESVAFRIRAPEAEIRGTIVADDGAVALTLTLVGAGDAALGGQRVFLRRHGRTIYSARTDAAGSLEMPRVDAGVYEVSCPGIGTSFRLDLRS